MMTPHPRLRVAFGTAITGLFAYGCVSLAGVEPLSFYDDLPGRRVVYLDDALLSIR